MGAYANAMFEQAQEDFSEALVNLFLEDFQRGSDSLGALSGPAVLAATVQVLGYALIKAADGIARKFDVIEGLGWEHRS